jgi:hypothetical protein
MGLGRLRGRGGGVAPSARHATPVTVDEILDALRALDAAATATAWARRQLRRESSEASGGVAAPAANCRIQGTGCHRLGGPTARLVRAGAT